MLEQNSHWRRILPRERTWSLGLLIINCSIYLFKSPGEMGILAVFLPHELMLLSGLIWLCTCSSPKKQVKKCVCVCGGRGSDFLPGRSGYSHIYSSHTLLCRITSWQIEWNISFISCRSEFKQKSQGWKRLNLEQQTLKLQRLCQSKKIFHCSDLLIWKML